MNWRGIGAPTALGIGAPSGAPIGALTAAAARDQRFHLGSHAVRCQRRPDGPALGGEVLGVQQRRGSRDRLGPHGEGGEVAVQGLLGVILGDRQGPDEVVEVARADFATGCKSVTLASTAALLMMELR